MDREREGGGESIREPGKRWGERETPEKRVLESIDSSLFEMRI